MRPSTNDPCERIHMARLFHAGLDASVLQLAAICVATPLVIWLGQHGLSGSFQIGAEYDPQAAASFRILPWVYLVIASGVAIHANVCVSNTRSIRISQGATRPSARRDSQRGMGSNDRIGST